MTLTSLTTQQQVDNIIAF